MSRLTAAFADVAFSPDNRWLASIHTNGLLTLWDLDTLEVV